MIAFLSQNVFAPLPAFSGRVRQAANGSIVLSQMIIGDAGNYTVEVNVRSVDVFKHTVILQVNSKTPCWVGGWMDGWMDGWVDGWMDE